MNVLRLTPHLYFPHLAERGWPVDFDPIGGMQTQIYWTVLELSKLGVKQNVLVAGMPGAPRTWHIDTRTIVESVSIPIPRLRSRVSGFVGFNAAYGLGCILWLIRNLLVFRRTRFDVIHSHCSGVTWPLVLGYLFSKLCKCKLVYTIHLSNLATSVPLSATDSVFYRLRRKVEGLLVARADFVVTLTGRTVSALVESR